VRLPQTIAGLSVDLNAVVYHQSSVGSLPFSRLEDVWSSFEKLRPKDWAHSSRVGLPDATFHVLLGYSSMGREFTVKDITVSRAFVHLTLLDLDARHLIHLSIDTSQPQWRIASQRIDGKLIPLHQTLVR
jgi:hypothetical protein